jgi:hypothetical protein
MGIKYQVRDNNNKVVSRTKENWGEYKRKMGFKLEVWTGAGKGWDSVQTSSYKKRNNGQSCNMVAVNPSKAKIEVERLMSINAIRCIRCGRECEPIDLGDGLCKKCWDRSAGAYN